MKLIDLLANEARTTVEAWCRMRTAAVSTRPGEILTNVLGQIPLYVVAADVSLTPRLALDGFWEIWATQALARQLKPSWRSVDVGANVGYYTAVLAACTEGQVIAVEPDVRVAECLQRTIAANRWDERVSLIEGAAVGTDGAYFERWDKYDCGASVVTEHGMPRDRNIAAHPLDAMLDGVDFLKIDTNGTEPDVLLGAERVLRRDRPQILLEWNPTLLGDHPKRHLGPLVEGGYELCLVTTEGTLDPRKLPDLPAEPAMLWLRPKV